MAKKRSTTVRKPSDDGGGVPGPQAALPDLSAFVYRDESKNGHPTCVRPEVGPVVADLIAAGWSETAVAAALGLNPKGRAWQRVKKEDLELAAALVRGRCRLEAELVNHLLRIARSRLPQAAISAMFLLKTRAGYKEGFLPEGESQPSVAVTINLPSPMSVEAYRRRVIDAGGPLIEGTAVEVAPEPLSEAERRERPEPLSEAERAELEELL